MPRRRPERPEPVDDLDALRGALAGPRVEHRRGRAYRVRQVTGVKRYVCPGCARAVEPGTEHLVVWRADGVLGDAADVDGRRHWHAHCWKVA